MARGRAKLLTAEKKLVDVKKAASAVTGIENAVGMDSESIVKMIDFVKRSAIDDVKQSQDSVNKDKQVRLVFGLEMGARIFSIENGR